jgi:hypothetical protein
MSSVALSSIRGTRTLASGFLPADLLLLLRPARR